MQFSQAQSRANLGLIGLVERAKDKIAKFSGGMKRRINLAIALMGHPKLLFLDEPTVGIDPQSRNNIYETMGIDVLDHIIIGDQNYLSLKRERF